MPESTRPSTRRYLKGEQTRDQIVQAAKQLFTERGYHNTSIYDLFDKSGISKGAFYHHWKTKEDLAFTILEEIKKAYEARIYSILENEARARDQIERVLQTISELNADPNWHYCKLMAILSTELDANDEGLGAAVHALREQWRKFWQKLLSRAQQQGDLRADIPAAQMSFLVTSTLCGVYLVGRKEDGQGERNQALGTLRKLLFT